MATHLNIIMPLKEFLHYTHELQMTYSMFLYIETRDEKKTRHVNAITVLSDLDNSIDESYSGFYFSAHPIPAKATFYDAGIYHYCIEGLGGRTTAQDLEMIKLRVISKTPDATIKKFFAAVISKLKKDKGFEKGIYSSSGQLYKTTFYLKSVVGQYAAWFDFERKTSPIKFEP